jgi:hypothetical protein
MSTYSWSYKTAIHRQVSAKRAKTEQEGPDKNAVCQIENDNVVARSSSSQNNDAENIVTPKRRKGNESFLCKLCFFIKVFS